MFHLRYILSLFLVCLALKGWSQNSFLSKNYYNLSHEPIDVIIPCVDKDIETLELCIDGIKQNAEIRRIIVISSTPLTSKAEWFDELNYPFNKFDIALQIFDDPEQANVYSSQSSRLGWIYQQLLKLYAPLVIPGISSNVLVVDADTIFLNPVNFLGPSGEGLYNPGSEYHSPYFEHMARLLPGLERVYAPYSGISHHMLFQREVITDLFNVIESYHEVDAWKAICRCIDQQYFHYSSLSEYEIYFNFIFTRTDQMQIRQLQWANISQLSEILIYKQAGYDYVSCHSYLR